MRKLMTVGAGADAARRLRARINRVADLLARPVGRLPVPIGAKLAVGIGVIAALLALVGVLGLVALGQSNARGRQLLELQQERAYTQGLLADTRQLSALARTPGLYKRSERIQLEGYVDNSLAIFAGDFGWTSPDSHRSTPLWHGDPAVARRVQNLITRFRTLLTRIEARDSNGRVPSATSVAQAIQAVATANYTLSNLANTTSVRASALVARNESSYRYSRNLLLGVGAGGLGLASVLGLLLAWSLVAPLRRTESRLDEIATGEFAGRLEVPNRDEIGRLAAKVNRMSDQLQELYRELETASRHKSDFLATMSHELRTPLNAIIGFSEVLQEQMFGELNERQLAYVEDVLEAGRHLLTLINEVLDLAKIEAGRMELELSRVAVPDVLRSAVSMHAESAKRGRIALALSSEPEEIVVTADERRFRQIVFNLLSNAVKFTPAEGRVDVSARLENGHVEIVVADTGSGIAAEDIETIFEEFEQASDGKGAAAGTGLGLPLSRKLVELHGGRLWVESEIGRGSTFRFTLPIEQEVS